jgi:hypothetical protein
MSLTKVTYSMIDGATVNVLDYGADPTGTSDSTAAIQAAIDYAKQVRTVISTGAILNVTACVYIPAGIYNISGITLHSSVRLLGESEGSVYLKYTGTDGVAIDIVIDSNDALFGVSIENLYLRNFGSGSTKGIRADRFSLTGESMAIRQCQLKNVTVQSFTYNVEIVDCWTFMLFRCFLWNAGQFNLWVKNPTHVYAEACRFDIAGSDSVRLINSTAPFPGTASLFVNCTFQRAQFWGLQAIDIQSCYLINPFFEQNNLAGGSGHCFFSDGAGEHGRHFAIYGGHFTATGVSGSTGVSYENLSSYIQAIPPVTLQSPLIQLPQYGVQKTNPPKEKTKDYIKLEKKFDTMFKNLIDLTQDPFSKHFIGANLFVKNVKYHSKGFKLELNYDEYFRGKE